MKIALDYNEKEVEVSDDTPVDTINGIHYLLTPLRQKEELEKKEAWEAAEPQRLVEVAINNRKIEYGTAEEQIEYAVENGWDALVKRNLAIKDKYQIKGE